MSRHKKGVNKSKIGTVKYFTLITFIYKRWRTKLHYHMVLYNHCRTRLHFSLRRYSKYIIQPLHSSTWWLMTTLKRFPNYCTFIWIQQNPIIHHLWSIFIPITVGVQKRLAESYGMTDYIHHPDSLMHDAKWMWTVWRHDSILVRWFWGWLEPGLELKLYW